MSFIGNKPDSFNYATTSYDHFNGDGSTTVYTLTRAVSSNSDIFVTVNNVPQDPGVAYYVNNLYSLVFTGAPSSGSGNITVTYRQYVQAGLAPAANTVTTSSIAANTIQFWQLASGLLSPLVDVFTANGATATFTLQQSPVSANSCTVTVNGLLQTSPANYSTNSNILTFTSNPANGSVVRCQQGSLTGTGVTPIDGSVTNSKLASNLTLAGTTVLSGGATIQGLTVGLGAGSIGTNTVLGVSALPVNTTGSNSVALGYQALQVNTTGSYNSAFGAAVLLANTTGSNNTAVGYNSLGGNTFGQFNTALGAQALVSNTTASNNTAVGYQAGYTNATGASLTALGYQAGYSSTGNYNTFVGKASGYTTTGADNTFIGHQAGYSVTTGSGNAFFGSTTAGSYGAGFYVTTGSKNTILGSYNGNQGGLDIRTSSNYIVLSDGDGNIRQVIDSSGNVGIGTASPSSKLTVQGTTGNSVFISQIAGATNNPYLAISHSESGSYSKIDANGSTVAASNLVFATLGNERMRIDSSGNVGIGTASPTEKITVAGAVIATGGASSIARDAAIVDYSSNNARFVAGRAGGNYGSWQALVAGASGITTRYQIDYDSTYRWYAADGTTERMRINSSGNVGIGTTNPIAKLSVSNGGAEGLEISPSGGTVGLTAYNRSGAAYAQLNLTGTAGIGVSLGPSYITTNSNMSVSNIVAVGGATPASSGSGITFPATQSASSDANTLDDYEEGTFTATLIGGTTSPTTPVTTTGKYTKVGNLVTIWIRFANKDTTGASGEMRVTGLPFTVSGESQAGAVMGYNLPIPGLYNVAAAADGSTAVYFYSPTNNSSWSTVNISAGPTKYLNFNITYFV